MRLFTAIELGDAVRAEAAAVSGELRRRIDESVPRARVTWVASERLHLTVRFIGEVEQEIAARVMSGLRAPLPIAPFVLAFDRLGAFPAKGPPRVIWIGVADGRDEAVLVERAISDRLAALDIPRDDRPYSPHLTLARVREPAGLRAAKLFEGLAPNIGVTHVEAITLFQSKLSPKGPTYVRLERTPLRAG